jgi:hypothetical protein
VTRKERKSGKKIFYVESSGQNGLHYLMLQNNVQKLQYFCDLAANAAEKLVRQKSAKLRHAAEKFRKAVTGWMSASSKLSLLQPALTSEKQKILLIQFILIN